MLYETFNSLKEAHGEDYFIRRLDGEIVRNLNPKFDLRKYQKEALGRFDFYFKDYQQKKFPAQLLFNMATGSGKTLIIAANILALYKMGYRVFIYFVHRNNILEKTRENFLNPSSSKYLFAEKIVIDGKEIKIREIESLADVVDSDINIMFTTINTLHERMNKPKENALVEEDFEGKEAVLIADEAHHYQAYTKLKDNNAQQRLLETEGLNLKGLNKEEKEELRAWEITIREKIFPKRNKDGEMKNILLEYTATMDLEHPKIKEKYKDKVIFKYDLVHFREDGYSKEIEVLEADIENPMERALRAVVLSQYRRKIAEKHKLYLKPVILFKSKTIAESRVNEGRFRNLIDNLQAGDLEKIKQNASKSLIKAFNYFQENAISLENLAAEIKNDFAPEKCLAVNSKEDSEEKQILVNSLEDRNNEIRAIFAVDMLNEGWDVLNLFDIVRLYETRDTKNNQPGRTTIAEAQLIGRGMRYWPFVLSPEQNMYQRKFDRDAENHLRILEQLYYHCLHQPKYVSELKTALIKMGAMENQREEKNINIKKDFKKTCFWQKGKIFLNKLRPVERTNFKSLSDLKVKGFYEYKLPTYFTKEGELLDDKLILEEQVLTDSEVIKIKKIPFSIIRCTLDKNKFFYFDNLKQFIPNLSSIKDFIKNWLGDVQFKITGRKVDVEAIRRNDVKYFPVLLEILNYVLNVVAEEIKNSSRQYEGTKIFVPEEIKKNLRNKTISFDKGSNKWKSIREMMDIVNKKWFAQGDFWGTKLELDFLQQFDDYYQKLKEKYEEIALIRNEQFWAIYNFEDGQTFYPDFVLFLRRKRDGKIESRQIFIEPKDEIYIKNEPWKQELILSLEKEAQIICEWEGENFKILSLPFYNEQLKKQFDEALEDKILA